MFAKAFWLKRETSAFELKVYTLYIHIVFQSLKPIICKTLDLPRYKIGSRTAEAPWPRPRPPHRSGTACTWRAWKRWWAWPGCPPKAWHRRRPASLVASVQSHHERSMPAPPDSHWPWRAGSLRSMDMHDWYRTVPIRRSQVSQWAWWRASTWTAAVPDSDYWRNWSAMWPWSHWTADWDWSSWQLLHRSVWSGHSRWYAAPARAVDRPPIQLLGDWGPKLAGAQIHSTGSNAIRRQPGITDWSSANRYPRR